WVEVCRLANIVAAYGSGLLRSRVWRGLSYRPVGRVLESKFFRLSFLKDFVAVHDAAANRFLLVFRQMNDIQTFGRAASFHGGLTIVALDEKQMATFVGAVCMIVAGFSALMAL